MFSDVWGGQIVSLVEGQVLAIRPATLFEMQDHGVRGKGHPFCQSKPVNKLTVAARLVVRLTVPFRRIKVGLEASKLTKKIPILQDFGASVRRAKMWSIYSH